MSVLYNTMRECDNVFAFNDEYTTIIPIYNLEYKDFQFYIVAAAAEYINDIEHHSYEKLTEEWGRRCYDHVIETIERSDPITFEGITMLILHSVLEEFSEGFLTDDQKEELADQIDIATRAFYMNHNVVKCNCGNIQCDGNCGCLPCGECIDVCRCGY